MLAIVLDQDLSLQASEFLSSYGLSLKLTETSMFVAKGDSIITYEQAVWKLI